MRPPNSVREKPAESQLSTAAPSAEWPAPQTENHAHTTDEETLSSSDECHSSIDESSSSTPIEHSSFTSAGTTGLLSSNEENVLVGDSSDDLGTIASEDESSTSSGGGAMRVEEESPLLTRRRQDNYALPTMHTIQVSEKCSFTVPTSFQFIKCLGSGAYGTVCSFHDASTGIPVAIKKIKDAFADLIDARRILREIRILRQLSHSNIVRMLDILPVSSPEFDDLYLVFELLDTDLHQIVQSEQPLTLEHVRYFLKQLLHALRYLHQRGVVHRDVKPSNLLLNLNCTVKLCDFGLAKGINCKSRAGRRGRRGSSPLMTDYVVTRWYRPPEVLLGVEHYSTGVDVWSAGCVLAEMLMRRALFTGRNADDQLKKILEALPSSDLTWLRGRPAQKANDLVASIKSNRSTLARKLRNQPPQAVDLITRMLALDPQRRITIEDALSHPFLHPCNLRDLGGAISATHFWFEPDYDPLRGTQPSHRRNGGPTARAYRMPINWDFDQHTKSRRQLQSMMYQDCALFNPLIVARDLRKLLRLGMQIHAFVDPTGGGNDGRSVGFLTAGVADGRQETEHTDEKKPVEATHDSREQRPSSR